MRFAWRISATRCCSLPPGDHRHDYQDQRNGCSSSHARNRQASLTKTSGTTPGHGPPQPIGDTRKGGDLESSALTWGSPPRTSSNRWDVNTMATGRRGPPTEGLIASDQTPWLAARQRKA